MRSLEAKALGVARRTYSQYKSVHDRSNNDFLVGQVPAALGTGIFLESGDGCVETVRTNCSIDHGVRTWCSSYQYIRSLQLSFFPIIVGRRSDCLQKPVERCDSHACSGARVGFAIVFRMSMYMLQHSNHS